MAENALVRYEVLFLTVPTVSTEDASALEAQFKDLVASNKGTMLSYEKWGKYNLAYEVRKNDYGMYFLSRFELPVNDLRAALENLRQFFAVKYNELVMRHVVARLAPNASLEYKRPESMEEAPRREAESMGKKDRHGSRNDFKESAVEEHDLDDAELEEEAV